MAVTEVTSQSWFSRIGGAIKGVIVGIILGIVGLALLFTNEGRAVKTARGLKEAGKAIVSVSADGADQANEGMLVHISGMAETEDILSDDEFGISENAVRLVRDVEMYQWEEDTERRSRSTPST